MKMQWRHHERDLEVFIQVKAFQGDFSSKRRCVMLMHLPLFRVRRSWSKVLKVQQTKT